MSPTEADARLAAAGLIPSPTGTPVIPVSVGPIVAALAAVAVAVQAMAPPHTIGYQIAGWVLSLAAVFGPVSAGWRR